MDPVTQSLKVDKFTAAHFHQCTFKTRDYRWKQAAEVPSHYMWSFQVVINQNNEQLMFPMFHWSNTRFRVQKDKAGASLNSLLCFWTWGSGRGYQKE